MLQLPAKLRKYICLLGTLVAVATQPATAKCISLQITLTGEITGATHELTVGVAVQSRTKGDSVSHVSTKSFIDRSHFSITALFDTTSNVIREETCDREPGLVTVTLMNGDHVLDRLTLSIETDFRRTKEGDFELAKPVVLHGREE